MSCGRLLNIASGKATSENTERHLNSIIDDGKSARLQFQKECAEDEGRLQRTVKRRPVVNFAKSQQIATRKRSKPPSNAESMRFIHKNVNPCGR